MKRREGRVADGGADANFEAVFQTRNVRTVTAGGGAEEDTRHVEDASDLSAVD